MQNKIMLTCLFALVCGCTLAQNQSDSILIDKVKVKEIIKKIDKGWKKNKQYPRKELLYEYPSVIKKGESFGINIRWRGEVIYIYDIDPITYEYGEVIDLR